MLVTVIGTGLSCLDLRAVQPAAWIYVFGGLFFVFFCVQGIESGALSAGGDFDQKLAEADAYLQILIEQLKVMQVKRH